MASRPVRSSDVQLLLLQERALIDRDAVWVWSRGRTKEPLSGWRLRSPREMGNFYDGNISRPTGVDVLNFIR